ncbi:D-2-hydroxyacid dehydrogenase [Sutcliffiella deserti]|uniref:D-2-hydroxyacid dehydrogenase n=1 Tax=Sutcliffiella deserti TaxID=2875501 RepID=UPI001CC0AACA|nr:D-2-hydroxyacid dehydrogenase [Sutcliffiella deserti]
MKKRTLLVTQDIGQYYKEQIKAMVPEWEVVIGKDKDVWAPYASEAEVILGWKKELEELSLNKSPNLKWIQAWSAGVNNIPLEKLSRKNILLTSANGVHAYPISETIFGLMLALTRKIHTYVKNQQKKVWHHAKMNLELHNKTVGIIGVGEIGKETAKIAKAFGMTVLGVRHSGKSEEYVDSMHTPEQLHTILPKCDYIVITLPLTPDTQEMFGEEEFILMKESAFLINIGRGEILQEDALIRALQNGTIAGAGLDVFVKEPLESNSPFWEMENVIITPHTSGSTEHYTKRVIEDIFIPNFKDYLNQNQPYKNLVDYNKGY